MWMSLVVLVTMRIYLTYLCATATAADISRCARVASRQVRNGHIKRITDQDIQSLVIDIASTNVR